MHNICCLPQAVAAGTSSRRSLTPFRLSWEGTDQVAEDEFSYILNPDGSIRWFFPTDTPFPTHLGLYNSAHWKARLYKWGTRQAFRLGQQKRLFSGQFWLKNKAQLPLFRLLSTVDHDSYAVFTGTAGENRKSVVALSKDRQITHFLKIAHQAKSASLLRQEAYTLGVLNQTSWEHWVLPQARQSADLPAIILTNIRPRVQQDQSVWSRSHSLALHEMYHRFAQPSRWNRLHCAEEVQAHLAHILQTEPKDPSLDKHQIDRLRALLKKLHRSLVPDAALHHALAHADFTPWNMYRSHQGLHVYDWELAREDLPLFYDFFHFHYQGGVLLKKYPTDRIHREIQRALQRPDMKQLIQHYGADIQFYHRLYLLYVISYYLRIYLDEPKVHMQVHWLLATWETAMENVLL
ncbi:MAG: hypothetical protein AAFP92_08755 [Bacteroidota bacterium]